MKKYIYTEAQIKGVIDAIMNERVIKERQLDTHQKGQGKSQPKH